MIISAANIVITVNMFNMMLVPLQETLDDQLNQVGESGYIDYGYQPNKLLYIGISCISTTNKCVIIG